MKYSLFLSLILIFLVNIVKAQTANQELFDLLLSNGTITPQDHAILTGVLTS
jgi:hypothetical protein